MRHAHPLPLKLLKPQCSLAAAEMFVGWRIFQGRGKEPLGQGEWCPVGTAGPILLLAHHKPETPLDLPAYATQRIIIAEKDYELLCDHAANQIRVSQSSEGMISVPSQDHFDPAGDIFQQALKCFALNEWVSDVFDRGEENTLADFHEAKLRFQGASALPIIDPTICEMTQRDWAAAFKNEATILSDDGRELFLALARPNNFAVQDALKKALYQNRETRERVHYVIAPPSLAAARANADTAKSKNGVRRAIGGESSPSKVLSAKEVVHTLPAKLDIRHKDVVGVYLNRPTTDTVAALSWVFWTASHEGASDIHFESYHAQGRIRIRVDGLAHALDSNLNSEYFLRIVQWVKTAAGMDMNTEEVMDGAFDYRIWHNESDADLWNCRVSAMPNGNGVQSVVIRIQNKTASPPVLENMNFLPEHRLLYGEALERPSGLILITGPTGSGKSMTLASFLNRLNKPDVKLNTVEDPIEYIFDGATQTRINEARGVTFKKAAAGLMRQDADYILLGEMRDMDSARTAFAFANTGHLTFATLHTNSAPEIVNRLLEWKIETSLLGSTIRLMQAQRLALALCPHCRRQMELTPEQRAFFEEWEVPVKNQIWHSTGCPLCKNAGYKGRVAVMEVIPVDEDGDIADALNSGADAKVIRRMAREMGFDSLASAALKRVARGETSFAEARQFIPRRSAGNASREVLEARRDRLRAELASLEVKLAV